MWNLSYLIRVEPLSPELAGGFLTTGPPGKSPKLVKIINLLLFSHSVMSDSLWPHARLPCPSLSPRVCSNSCPLSQWCHPTISSSPTILFSVIPFSSCPQSFPASGSFPMSRLSASSVQSIGASASALVLSLNLQCWFPLGLTGLISCSPEDSPRRVFSSTTVRSHQFFGVQPSLQSNSHIHTWLLEKPVQSVNQFSCSVVSDSLWPHGLQHARLPCPSPTPGTYSNSRPLSRWYHPTILFSSCLQLFLASGSFPMSHLFA